MTLHPAIPREPIGRRRQYSQGIHRQRIKVRIPARRRTAKRRGCTKRLIAKQQLRFTVRFTGRSRNSGGKQHCEQKTCASHRAERRGWPHWQRGRDVVGPTIAFPRHEPGRYVLHAHSRVRILHSRIARVCCASNASPNSTTRPCWLIATRSIPKTSYQTPGINRCGTRSM